MPLTPAGTGAGLTTRRPQSRPVVYGGVRDAGPGLGQETAGQARPVLHPPEPGLHQGGQLADAALGQVGQGSVAKEPELLSPSYRNRVRKLSPGNQNRSVKHLPGSHK